MATGWRGRGRRDTTSPDAAASPGTRAIAASGRTPPASQSARPPASDLTRAAAWNQLSGTERSAVLAPYAALAAPTLSGNPAPLDRLDDPTTQAWVCDLVSPHLQAPAMSILRTWLADSAPSAHLYVMGGSGRGRTSAVATLARRALANRPASPDYCYVPDPDAPSHSWVLALPAGTGSAFAEALATALHQIQVAWEKPRERARAEGDDDLDEVDDPALRLRLIERSLDTERTPLLAAARPYLERLASAIAALSPIPTIPPLAEVDAPAGRALVPPVQAAGVVDTNTPQPDNGDGSGATADPQLAPIIVGSLARMRLVEALLRANGGVLVLLAADFVDRDQLTNDWAPLRAILQTGALYLRGNGEPAIPITTRVALIGSYGPFRVLERAEGFARLFRYKARFEEDTAWTPEAEAAYAALSDGVARRYAIPPFDASAVARLVEEGARRSGRQQRAHLTTDLLGLRDLALEAGRQAQASAASAAPDPTLAGIVTTANDVAAAVARRRMEQGSFAREAREMVLSDREIVPTVGSAVGQINGLGVATLTPFEGRYAVPFRISAAVSPGREQLVDIEREADAADPSHISATLTMAGYLTWRYGREHPTSVVARLRFEQEHEYTSGPSASAAELFALLSALAGVPIRRALAVTGAVGQHGELQVIGGVNEKVEGFWEISRARRERGERPDGGTYGVVIPAANAQDLMLRDEVVAAIAEDGWFSVWPLNDVDEGLPLLMGMSARDVHARVARQLRRYNEIALRDLPR